MLQNAYLLAKIGADTAESERDFAENLPKFCENLPNVGPSGSWLCACTYLAKMGVYGCPYTKLWTIISRHRPHNCSCMSKDDKYGNDTHLLDNSMGRLYVIRETVATNARLEELNEIILLNDNRPAK